MKNRIAHLTPAEAGYFTTNQWDAAFQQTFDLLRKDLESKKRPAPDQPAGQMRMFKTAFGLRQSKSSNNHQRFA